MNNYMNGLKRVTIEEQRSNNNSIRSNGSFEQVSVGSFEDENGQPSGPGGKRNNNINKTKHKNGKYKKIKFDDIMRGVQYENGSPIKKAATIVQGISIKTTSHIETKKGKEQNEISKPAITTSRKTTNKTFIGGSTKNYIQFNKKVP